MTTHIGGHLKPAASISGLIRSSADNGSRPPLPRRQACGSTTSIDNGRYKIERLSIGSYAIRQRPGRLHLAAG